MKAFVKAENVSVHQLMILGELLAGSQGRNGREIHENMLSRGFDSSKNGIYMYLNRMGDKNLVARTENGYRITKRGKKLFGRVLSALDELRILAKRR